MNDVPKTSETKQRVSTSKVWEDDGRGDWAVRCGGHTQVLAAVSFRGCTPTISDFKHFEECYSLSLF